MSCLGQCGDCKCQEIDICVDTSERNAQMDKKLRVLKDYACLLGTTTCANLPKRVGQYAYFMWCYLRDLNIMVKNTNLRTDNLCEVAKCQDRKLQIIAEHINGKALENIVVDMRSEDSTGLDGDSRTYTDVEVSPDGTFKVLWNMIDSYNSGTVGNGFISGKVTHRYEQNKDGSITAFVDNFTIHTVTYVATGVDHPRKVASISVKDSRGTAVYRKTYDPTKSWSENSGSTYNIGAKVNLNPKGGQSGFMTVLQTEDVWDTNPTIGTVQIQYTNNNSGPIINLTPCPIKCGACENKEEEV